MAKAIATQSRISWLGLLIWGVASLFYLYEFSLRTFLGSIAHAFMQDLHLNAAQFATVGAGYFITYGLMQLPVGILADKFNVKYLMLFAVLICMLSAFWLAHATTWWVAFGSRILMGFGSSFAFVCAMVIVNIWFSQKYFALFAGISQFIGTLGPLLAAGPIIAIMAKFHLSWRYTLEDMAWFGGILAILIGLIVRKKPRDTSAKVIVLIPTEPLRNGLARLIKNQQAWWVAVYCAATYASLSLLGAIWGTEYLQAQGFSQNIAADIISLSWFGYAIGCPLLGAWSDMVKRRKPTLIFCAVLGTLATTLILYAPWVHQYWAYGLLFFMLGIAGSAQNVGFAAISEHVESRTRATAMGFNNAAIILFAAILPPIVSYFIDLSAKQHALPLQPHDFLWGLSAMPLLYILSVGCAAFFIEETYCRPQKEAVVLIRESG